MSLVAVQTSGYTSRPFHDTFWYACLVYIFYLLLLLPLLLVSLLLEVVRLKHLWDATICHGFFGILAKLGTQARWLLH